MVDLHACILCIYTGADSISKYQDIIHYILFCLAMQRVCGWSYYHCIVKQLVFEWIVFVGVVSGKG